MIIAQEPLPACDKWYLVRAGVVRPPSCQLPDVIFTNLLSAVEITQDGFENNADRDRQPRDVAETCFCKLRQRIIGACRTVAGGECLPCIK